MVVLALVGVVFPAAVVKGEGGGRRREEGRAQSE